MSEVMVLSNDLNVVTAEINSYKQVAGHAIHEIGRRLKHVKEKDLTHGMWDSWLAENVLFSNRQARRLIQVFEEFKSDDVVRFGGSKIFELLQMPGDRDDFLDKTHTVPSTGEEKTVDEMTVKELREVKKSLKEAEERANQAQTSAEHAIELKAQTENALDIERKYTEELKKSLDDALSRAPQTIEVEVEKVIEVVPESIRARMAEMQRQLTQKDELYVSLSDEYQAVLTEFSQLTEERETWATSNYERLAGETARFHSITTEFLREVSVYSYLSRHVSDLGDVAYGGYMSAISALEDFVADMRRNIERVSQTIITEPQIVVRPRKMIGEGESKIAK